MPLVLGDFHGKRRQARVALRAGNAMASSVMIIPDRSFTPSTCQTPATEWPIVPRRRIGSEEIVQRLLHHDHHPSRFSLRWLLLLSLVAPVVISLIYAHWVTIWTALAPPRVQPVGSSPPFTPIYTRYAVLAASLSLVCFSFVLAIVRAVGHRWTKYVAPVLLTTCGFAGLVALGMAALDGHGIRKVWVPDGRDLYVIFAVPLAGAGILAAILGWVLVETE